MPLLINSLIRFGHHGFEWLQDVETKGYITKGSVPLRLLCATTLYQTMEDRDASVADAALKRVSVPQYCGKLP